MVKAKKCGIVILVEGMTDFLALTIVSSLPVLGAPGAGMARHSIAKWVRGRELYLGLDMDKAGLSEVVPTARAAYECGAEAVYRLPWPYGQDACDALKRMGAEDLALFLEETVRVPTAVA